MSEKTLESVESEDETTTPDTQEEIPSQEDESDETDEESTDDLDDGEEEADKKPFKNRKERADFFKKKDKGSTKDDSDVLRKSDLFKINEKKAVRLATEISQDDPEDTQSLKKEINDNWESIVAYFNPKTDRSDPEVIAEAIIDAHTVWKRRNPQSDKGSDKDGAARAALAREQGTKGSSGKGTPERKKTILGNSSKGMDDWYPSED